MKIPVLIILVIFCSVFPGTHLITDSNFSLKDLVKGDSVLFQRGKRYFTHINLIRYYNPENIYFGSFGDEKLSKPILDGSIFHFEFNSENWKDYEIIKGVKFYKKEIKGLESAENVYSDKLPLTMAREPDAQETVIKGMKNSFTGWFLIGGISPKEPNKIFYDPRNKTDWTGADAVTKTQQWSYEIRKILNNKDSLFEVSEKTADSFRKGWGYFIQRHYSALDKEGEWFYDESKGILYFSATMKKCVIYVSSNRENDNSGFDITGRNGIVIDGLIFAGYKHGIKLEDTQDVTVRNCGFYNCTYGVINKTTYLERISLTNNTFRNMHSYGIRLIANNSVIEKNNIDSVGLTMHCESKGYDNLDGIELYGKNNLIVNNVIKNTGYCGIRIYDCPGTKVIKNHVENTDLMVADGGAIYTYNSYEGNKLIRGNTVKNVTGNVSGTDGDEGNACGIYLDELSFHFRVDSNYVSNACNGIYIQNSRSDTVMYNRTENNNMSELHINHAGSILNGGRLNSGNDPSFDPEKLDKIPSDYLWDKIAKILYYIDGKQKKPVYIEQGNNMIRENEFIPDKDKFTFTFRTWRNIDNYLLESLTGNKDFFRSNVSDSLLKNASLQIIGANVKDFTQNGKVFDKLQNTFDKTIYDYLRKVHIYIGRGAKFQIEK